MTWTVADYQYMSRALQLARRGLYTTHPNPRVGCILVKNDRVIAEGWHEYTGGPHAEANALKNSSDDVKDATCYVTLEPCCHSGRTPPCTDALIEAGIKKTVAAMLDPNPAVSGQGKDILLQAGIKFDSGLLADQAAELNRGYIMRRTSGRPLVRCKLAVSLDGRTALADGTSKWITGPEARLDVQHLRAQCSAVMTGIGTVLADDPSLNVREINLARQPLRVIIDPELKFPVSAKMLGLAGRTLIFTGNHDPLSIESLQQSGADIVQLDADQPGFLQKVLSYLAEKEEINEVLLESGATLAGNMLNAGFIDELIVYQSPHVLGDSARGMFHLPAITDMNGRIELEMIETRQVGKDVRLTYKVKSTK